MLQCCDSMSATGKEAVYGDGGLPESVLAAVLGLAVLASVATVIIIFRHLQQPAQARWKAAFQVAWIFWIFAPPIWFSWEYFYLFKSYAQAGTFEAFKYGQELAYRAWVGIGAAMTLLYVRDRNASGG